MTGHSSVGSNSGIKVISYTCHKIYHRKTAVMKQHAKRYVAETKNDILTAFDLKRGLESNGGVKGCPVSVSVEMPKSPNQVGKGEWLENDATLSVNIPKLNVDEAFSSECLNTGVMAAISKCSHETGDATVEKCDRRVSFDFPIYGCICSYESDAGLHKHLDISNHVRRFHRENV